MLNIPASHPQLSAAVDLLRRGGLVAFPTETVYGLGAHAMNPDAVRRIFRAKGRPADNPLIVHVADLAQVEQVATELTPLARDLMARWSPGPLTVVLDARPGVPEETTGGLRTVAVRIPDHPLASALLNAVASPLAAPSANRSGRPSPTTAAHVADELGTDVDLILDGGPSRVGVESTVVDARGVVPVVLREGAVSREHLDLGHHEPTAPPRGDDAASPGTRYRHYAPDCRVVVAPLGRGAGEAALIAGSGRKTGLLAPSGAPDDVVSIARPQDAAGLGQVLYDSLRAAERAGLDVLVIEAVQERHLGRAVMDRVRRAAGLG